MQFHPPLEEGILLKRYKRFFADLQVGKSIITAHVPNSGSMEGCNHPGSPCRFSRSDSPTRKLALTLEMVHTPESWVGVNTSHPNRIVHEAWNQKKVTSWSVYDHAQREVKVSDSSRLDLVLWKSSDFKEERIKGINFTRQKPFHFIEIKNVSMARQGVALFPDAPTERGRKHLLELMKLKEASHECELVFIIQREDCGRFSPADDIDPEYGRLLRQAKEKGVLITPFACEMSQHSLELIPKVLPLFL